MDSAKQTKQTKFPSYEETIELFGFINKGLYGINPYEPHDA